MFMKGHDKPVCRNLTFLTLATPSGSIKKAVSFLILPHTTGEIVQIGHEDTSLKATHKLQQFTTDPLSYKQIICHHNLKDGVIPQEFQT